MTKPLTVLVDLDGTLALRGDRSPFAWSEVLRDEPNQNVVLVVKALARVGMQVVVLSGRDSVCRSDTETWITRVLGFGPQIFMRQSGDGRPDYVIKEEIYWRDIFPQYEVGLVLDDRDQCVELWRRLGLTTFQVAEGNF